MMTNSTQTRNRANFATKAIAKSLKTDVGNMKLLLRTSLLFCLVGAMPIAANAATYLYHNDHLGTPQVLTDANQQVVWQSEQQPFGEIEATTNQVEQNIRFPGQYFDVETGLNYNYHRNYNSTTGRYTQSDPVGLFGGVNTYAYALQNPIAFSDPLGLYSCSCINVSSSGGGNGTTIDGRKQFNYSCTCACGSGTSHSFIASGGSQGGDSTGQTALGSKLSTGVSPSGQLYTHATGFDQFDLNSNPKWYQFWHRGETTLNKNINSTMQDLCDEEEDSDATGCNI